MTLVVDASVVIKWFVEESMRAEAVRFLGDFEDLHAPDLLAVEVTSTAWKKAARRQIGRAQAEEIASAIRGGIPLLHPSALFNERALELAFALEHSIYDCLYLACAEALDARLATVDTRFARAARKAGLGQRMDVLS